MAVLYWQVECRATQPVVFAVNHALQRWRSCIVAAQDSLGGRQTPWPHWDTLVRLTEAGHCFELSGQIGLEHGIGPWLWLTALKKAAFWATDVGIVTDTTRETATDLRQEAALLQTFGTDLVQIRPLAESLGLLLPALDLIGALGDTDTDWF